MAPISVPMGKGCGGEGDTREDPAAFCPFTHLLLQGIASLVVLPVALLAQILINSLLLQA